MFERSSHASQVGGLTSACYLAVVIPLLTLTSAAQETAVPPAAVDQLPPVPDRRTATEILLQDRPIGALQASLAAPTPVAPENLAKEVLSEQPPIAMPLGAGRGWMLQAKNWEAPATRNQPLYFEEPNLERLGYYYAGPADNLGLKWWGPDGPHPELLQTAVSAAHFYGRVAAFPYMVGAQCPWQEVYTLGYEYPGSPVPYRKYLIPISLKGALYQGMAVTGLGYIIP